MQLIYVTEVSLTPKHNEAFILFWHKFKIS